MTERQVYESARSKLIVLDQKDGNKPVALKVLYTEFPTPQQIALFFNEFRILEDIESANVRRVIKKSTYDGRPAVELEWVEGQTLHDYIQPLQGELHQLLDLAIKVASAVDVIHRYQVIHKDLNLDNILVEKQSGTIKLIDFALSTKLDLKVYHLGNPASLDMTLAYASPEQTGRMNRVVDYRSDLYSLGVLFFEIFTGRLPFETTDSMELVHSHLAVAPPLANSINAEIPEPLAKIIHILLAKNAEDRYQSAKGLEHDLEHCLLEYQTKGTVASFELRRHDFLGKFQVSQKLFGRESEIEKMLAAFERCARGNLEMFLIGGYSGVGKSALVHEIHKPITQKRGFFIEGKFEQFQRTVPYYAFLQAFGEFITFLLTESEEVLSTYYREIQTAVGLEGKVLTDVIPNLVHIIGVQPDVPEIGAAEAQNRFNYVFGKFVNAISKPEHPIVLFIDDLQWADLASISLLKVLMSDTSNGYLLFVGAYRDNEVNEEHPFMLAVDELKQNHVRVEEISVGNLSSDDVNRLISESVNASKNDTIELSKLVFSKTQGNAFFVTKFLLSLEEEKLLQFNHDKSQWVWDLKKVEGQNITNNVVTLMADKIQKLPIESQLALKLAACMGFTFDLEKLAIIYEKDISTTRRSLNLALSEGLIVPAGTGYKFSHDRIQQAVYSLIPEDEKDVVHLRIGRLLLENAQGAELEDQLFDIVTHLNHGKHLISNKSEIGQLAEYNLRAGKKAKQAYAFKEASNFLAMGISLLPPDHWQTQYQVSRELYTLAAESAYLESDFESMDKHLAQIIHPDRKILDQVAAYEIRIQALIAQNQLNAALDVGLDILRKLKVKFPAHPNDLQVIVGLLSTKIRLLGKSFEELENLPQLTDELDLARMRLCTEITPPAYWVEPKVLLLAVFKIVRLTVTKGASLQSIYAFGTYGMVMCELGDIPLGQKFGRLTEKLLENPASKAIHARSKFLTLCFIRHWSEPLRESIQPFYLNYHLALETGDLDFAALSYYFYVQHGFYSGKSLPELVDEMEAVVLALERVKQSTPNNYLKIHLQTAYNLLNETAEPTKLRGPFYDSDEMVAKHIAINDRTALYKFHFCSMQLNYFAGNTVEAFTHSNEAFKFLDGVTAQHVKALYPFFDALICACVYEESEKSAKSQLLKRIEKAIKKLKIYANYCSANFQHKLNLVQAEFFRISGEHANARVSYEKAIESATNHHFTQFKALAYELAGKYFLSQNAESFGSHCIDSAYNAYGEWGAKTKQLQLLSEYKFKLEKKTKAQLFKNSVSSSGTQSLQPVNLDLNTVLKAATTISGEIVLPKLLSKLLEIAIENAGAEHGILLLEKNGTLLIEGRSTADRNKTSVLEHLELKDSDLLAESVVKFVKRTSESVVIQNAMVDSRFENDPYILSNKPKSILALPINSQGKLIGILYFENNLITGAFTQERIEVLALLSGQFAVSIDNARLYEGMEQKVRDRTVELEQEKKKSDDLLYNILPRETADELKRDGKAIPRKYESVTVLFTDFKGFTLHSESLQPDELVFVIDECFSAFDEIISKHGIEKIKTIGDAYMCVAGLPKANKTHAEDATRAALEINEWVCNKQKEFGIENKSFFEIRIGLHSGPVVAGVVGSKKFAYDIWGDTVNTASRMESSGTPGKVNISNSTYELIQDKFECQYRGRVEAKNKGEIDMYFVEREMSEM